MILKTNSKDVPDNINWDNFGTDFYTNYPANARAIFSTEDGAKAFRKANVDSFVLQRERELWSREKVEAECDRIRIKCSYHHIKALMKPQTPIDLYKYFDAYDIYINGPKNLWDVLNTLCDENKIIAEILPQDYNVVINIWIDEWLACGGNIEKLVRWNPEHGPVTSVFSERDDMRGIPIEALAIVEENLKTRWRNLQGIFPYWQHQAGGHVFCPQPQVGGHVFYPQPQVGGHVFDNYATLAPSPSNMPAQCTFDNRYSYPPLLQFEQPYHPRVRDPSAVEALRRTSAAAMPNWAPTDQPRPPAIVHGPSQSRPTSSVRNQDKNPKEHHEQKELVNRGNQQVTTSLTNAALPNHDNQLHLSVNTNNNVKPAKVEQTQASPSPLPRNHRFVQHGTTNGKIALAQRQPPVLKGPQPNDAKKPGTTAPEAAEDMPSPSQAPIMVGVQSAKKGGNPPRYRAHPQDINGKPAGGHMPGTMNQTVPVSYSGPPSQSPQARDQENLASSARVEPPTAPKLVKHCAAWLGNAPHIQSTAYANGSPMKSDGNHLFGGAEAFRAQLSHQMPKVAPGGSPSPNATTPAFRDGRGSQGGYRNKGRCGPAAEYPTQAGKEAFYSQNTHVVDTTRKWQRNVTQNCNTPCRNKNRETYEYYDCSCTKCGEKNRSIWLKVTKLPKEHPEDVKSRLKSGMQARFGNVQEVIPTFYKTANTFLVRFENEASVARSLKFSSLALREKNLFVSISPAFRSKWIITAGANNADEGRLRNQQWRSYQNATHSPISPGMRPAQTYNLAGHNARGPYQLRPVYGMKMPHIPHDLNRRVCSMDYYQQGHQAHAFAPISPQLSVMLQQPPAQSAQGPQVPNQEARKAISRPQRPEEKELTEAKEATKSLQCKAQSKPPSEEALENDNPIEKDGVVTPTTQGSPSSQMSSRKVKVAFPLVSPSRPTQLKAHKIEKPTKDSGKSPVDIEAPSKAKNTCKGVVIQSQSSHTGQVPNQVSRQVSLEASTSATTTAETGTTACFEPLPSDTTCHVPEPAQHSPAAETMSVKSAESKTLSASSSPGNCSPPRNLTKTPLIGKTSGSPSRHQSQVSKTIGSPVKNTEANKDQKLNSQAENVAERGFRFPTSADQGSFRFPDNGRGTIRAKKAEKRETVCHEGFGQGRDMASMKRGQRNPLASQSIDFNHQNQQQANLPRGEVIQATDSAAGNDASASATSHSRQERNTSPASDRGINKDSLRDASGSGDSGGESGWRKVQRRRRTSKKTNTPESNDRQARSQTCGLEAQMLSLRLQ